MGAIVKVWNFRIIHPVFKDLIPNSKLNPSQGPVSRVEWLGLFFHVLPGAWADSTFPTFTAFLPRSKGHLSQTSPADTQLSKGCIMWSGQWLLTKLFPHWETNSACLSNFRVKNVFSSLHPYSSLQFQNDEDSSGHQIHQQRSHRSLGSKFHHFHWVILWGKTTARGDVGFLDLKRKQRCPFSRGFLLKGKSHF